MSNRQLLIIFLLILTSSGFSQGKIKNNHIREVIVKREDSVVRTHILTEKITLDTKDQLLYYWYQADRINSNYGGYSGNLLHGGYSVFVNTELVCKGTIHHGLKDGIWRSWYPGGSLRAISSWQKGQKQGQFATYDSNGNIVIRKNFKNGLLHGDLLIQQGDTVIVQKYKNGKEIVPKTTRRRKESKEITDTTSVPSNY